MLGHEQKLRYSRQRRLDGIGDEGQLRLINGSVGVVGCGALGSLCAMYLAGAGIGRIGLCEFDTIDVSNLQRQLFYATSDAGNPKLATLSKKISALNPDVCVEEYPRLLTAGNAEEFISRYDVIVEATDNPKSKYLVDAATFTLGKPCCIGGVNEFSGQAITCVQESMRYSDVFPELPDDGGFTPCSMGGVLGPAAGVVASVQASEVIKLLTGCGTPLVNSLLTFNLATDEFNVHRL